MTLSLSHLDHFVLTVADIEASCAFYEKLGMQVVTFGAGARRSSSAVRRSICTRKGMSLNQKHWHQRLDPEIFASLPPVKLKTLFLASMKMASSLKTGR